jgi:hypothetical protein
MNHTQIIKAIQFIRPDAEFSLSGEELTWLDENQTEPTQTEIEAGWIAYEEAKSVKAEAKAAQRQALLNRLGITEEEARILLGGN